MSAIKELTKAAQFANNLCLQAGKAWELSGKKEDHDRLVSLAASHKKIQEALDEEIQKENGQVKEHDFYSWLDEMNWDDDFL